jgi:sec-independent protein translocase protein TatC
MSEEKEMSFLDHLEELRWHVVRSVFAILLFVILAFVYTPWIFEHIIFAPARPDFATFKFLCKIGDWTGSESLCVKYIPFRVQSRNMTGQFTMQFTAGFVIGLIVAFPYVVWEVWRFIKPGLHNRELKVSRGVVASISFLFILGISFGYYVMAPMSIWFFTSYSISPMIVNEFDITSYVSTIVTLVLGSGLLFQLPVVVYFLTQLGFLTPKFMRQYRKHAIIIILIIAAFITPPDPISQTVIAIPLYLLYEVSIFISALALRKKRKADEAELLAEQAQN